MPALARCRFGAFGVFGAFAFADFEGVTLLIWVGLDICEGELEGLSDGEAMETRVGFGDEEGEFDG